MLVCASFLTDRLANPALGFDIALKQLLPLLGERAGVRENVTSILKLS